MAVLQLIAAPEAAGEINAAHRACESSLKQGLQHAVRCGELLIAEKARHDHGAWLPWMAQWCEFGVNLAQRYMKVARFCAALGPNTARVQHLTFKETLALAGKTNGFHAMSEADQDKALNLVESGDARNIVHAKRLIAYETKRDVALAESVTGRYGVLLADPPWKFSNTGFKTGTAENHYPPIATDDLCNMPVGARALDNAVLFLWASNPMLKDALRVIEAWGFEYKTNMVWVKDYHTYIGFYVDGFHELLLIATRGSMLPARESLPPSVIKAKRSRHSKKPTRFYEVIEGMYPGIPGLELFARAPRKGWTAWGNEVQ